MKIDYLSKAQLASYFFFDILCSGKEDIMDKPLSERKKILKEELEEDDIVSIIDYFPEKEEAYFKAAVRLGLEGIMGKKESSVYHPGILSMAV